MAMTAPQPPFVHYETPSTELLFAWCLCRAGTAHISSVGFMFLSRGEHHRAIWLVHLVAVTTHLVSGMPIWYQLCIGAASTCVSVRRAALLLQAPVPWQPRSAQAGVEWQ
uniref:Uncharacterized protein n=1 Tax=Eutreptiella gymnastica TaxID=73025 RepID=A0A7S4LCB8_9EUGL